MDPRRPSRSEVRQAVAMLDLATMVSDLAATDAPRLGNWWFQWKWFTERAEITARYRGDVELWASEALA